MSNEKQSRFKDAVKTGMSYSGMIMIHQSLQKAFDIAAQEKDSKIRGKLLGLGVDDNALYENAKAGLTAEQKRLLSIFENKLEENGYSFFWFQNVIGKQQEGEGKSEDSRATKTLKSILEGGNFEDQLKIAGRNLIKKKFGGRVKDGWEVVKEGKYVYLLHDGAIISKDFLTRAVKEIDKQGNECFKVLKPFLIASLLMVGGFLLVLLISFFVILL
jgi:hypothetical protein